MGNYRLKAVEAVQFIGSNVKEIESFTGARGLKTKETDSFYTFLKGDSMFTVSPGEFVVKKSNGGFYAVEENYFINTYELV